MFNNDITGYEIMCDCKASILMDCPFDNHKVIANLQFIVFCAWLATKTERHIIKQWNNQITVNNTRKQLV